MGRLAAVTHPRAVPYLLQWQPVNAGSPTPFSAPHSIAGIRPLAAIGAAGVAVLVPVYRLQGLSWPEAAASALVFVLPGVLLGWLVWRRETLSVRSRRTGFGIHVLLALAFSLTWTLTYCLFVLTVRADAMAAFLDDGAVWQVTWGLLIYAIVAWSAGLQRRLRQREHAAENAELQALRAQLNPHFLFNTLHALTQLARENPAATAAALERFADLLRYVLHRGRDAGADMALEDEIAFVHHYLALEQLRLGERLRVLEDLAPEALELAVPPLLLQPLVENAIRHGIAPLRDGGTLQISARADASTLTIEVADDGVGASTDTWQSSPGLGLTAAARQLEAQFPGRSSLTIASTPGNGFRVRISMPAQLPGRRR